jgi:hypothetical protein
MNYRIAKEIQNLKIVRDILTNGAIVCFLLQILVDLNLTNVICCSLALAAFLLTNYAVLNIRNRSFVNAFPASIIFFIVSANSIAPLGGTLLEGNSLRSNLEYPIDTFLHRFIFSLILIICLYLTHSKLNSSLVFLNEFAERIKINRLYSPRIVWILGLLSLVIFFFKFLPLPVTISKFLDGFGFLLWGPFILLFPPYPTNTNSKTTKRWLLVYYIIMVILSFITNSRMGMIGPIIFVAMSYLMVFLTGRIEINKKIFTKFFIIGIIGFVGMGILADISTAMLIERAYREDRGMLDQISATFNTFNNKEKLDETRLFLLNKNDNLSSQDWKEDYISNGFISRFVQIKFDDNCFTRIYGFSPAAKEKLVEVSIDKLLVVFPSPILDILGLNVDKLYVNSYSMGDMIDVLSGHGFLGGLKTGSIIAHAYGVFGWWYPFVILILFFLIFRTYQYLICRSSNLIKYNNISTLSLILPFYLFTTISLDNISSVAAILIRGVWQTILIYFIALYIANKIDKLIK